MAPSYRTITTVCLCLLAASVVTVSAEYCDGYTNLLGWYISGFSCPNWGDDWGDTWCCGNYDFKYCCNDESDRVVNSGGDDVSWDDDLDDVANAVALGFSAIIGIVCGVIGLLIVGPILCCVCCAMAGKSNKRGGTTVISAGAAAPAAPTVINTTMQMDPMQQQYQQPMMQQPYQQQPMMQQPYQQPYQQPPPAYNQPQGAPNYQPPPQPMPAFGGNI